MLRIPERMQQTDRDGGDTTLGNPVRDRHRLVLIQSLQHGAVGAEAFSHLEAQSARHQRLRHLHG